MLQNKKIQVLIVDDVEDTRKTISKLLRLSEDFDIVDSVATGKEAIDSASQNQPDVILMDINLPDTDGITAAQEIRYSSPNSQIVFLTVQDDLTHMRKAMTAGARDYLVKPSSSDELIDTVKRAGKFAISERIKSDQPQRVITTGVPVSQRVTSTQGKIITVYSPKGGTGTSTIAANLSVTLQSPDSMTVLVDGNLQYGDTAIFLNEQIRTSVYDLAQNIKELDPDLIEEVLIENKSTKLNILAPPPKLEHSESITPDQFTSIVKYIKRLFNYVVIDTQTTLDDITLACLDMSDIIIVLLTQDIPAVKNVKLFLDITDNLDIDRNKIIMVMNKFDKKLGLTSERIGSSLKQEISCVLPFDDQTVWKSINRGIPFVVSDKNKPLSRGIEDLKITLIEKISSMELEPIVE